jgi:hypothetical protein
MFRGAVNICFVSFVFHLLLGTLLDATMPMSRAGLYAMLSSVCSSKRILNRKIFQYVLPKSFCLSLGLHLGLLPSVSSLRNIYFGIFLLGIFMTYPNLLNPLLLKVEKKDGILAYSKIYL